MVGTRQMTGYRTRILVAVGASVTVFVLASLAAASDSVHPFVERPGGVRVRRDTPVVTAAEQEPPPDVVERADGAGDGSVIELIVRLALVLAILIAAVFVVQLIARVLGQLRFQRRLRLRDGRWDMAEPTGHVQLAEVVDEGLRALETGDVTDVIIACWVKLEEASAAAGVARDPSETAFELTARVLHHHNVSVGAIETLLDLYREARYSEHGMGDDSRAEAQAALARVRADLATSMMATP